MLLFSSCAPSGNGNSTVVESPTSNTIEPVLAEEMVKELGPEDTNYVRHAVLGEYKFTAVLDGPGKSVLSVTVQKGDSILPAYSRECRDQKLSGCFASDLNANGFPEVHVATTKPSPSGGSIGSLYSYEIKNGVIRESLLPEMNDAAKKGYRGGETWEINSPQSLLIRKFKLFLFSDADCCPTGGQRFVNYTMDANGGLVFKTTQSMERVVVPGQK